MKPKSLTILALVQLNFLSVYGNSGANGGAIRSIGVSWSIYNSLFSCNKAIGYGCNPVQAGTPCGGKVVAIHNDGNTMTLALYGSLIEHNEVNAYGSAIFFVCNNLGARKSAHFQNASRRKAG